MNWYAAANMNPTSIDSEESMLLLQRQVMEKYVPIVVLKLQKSLPFVVQNWINDNLTDTNICELSLLYKKTLDGSVEETKVGFHPTLWEEFQGLCERESHETCKVPLEIVFEVAQKLNQGIQKSFDVSGCFLDEVELDIIGANETEILTKNLEATFVLPATKVLSEKLMKIHKEKNKSILAVHMLKPKKIVNSIKRIYRNKMETYMKNNSMSQTELLRQHSGLQADALQVFDKNFGDNAFGKNITIHESCKEELRQDLENEFRLYQVKNNEQLSGWATQQENRIQRLVVECITDIEGFGKSTERKLTGETLTEIYRITKKLNDGMDLCNELILKVETPSECMKIYWLALEEEFENVWTDFVFGKHLTLVGRGEIVYKEFLNIHQEKMEAAKTNDCEDIIALHKNLLEECVTVFENIVPYCQDQYNKEQLESQLNATFNITIASRFYYLQYKEKMENLLRRNNHSMESDTFLGHHKEIKNELTKLLEIEGRKKLGDMSQDYLPQHIFQLENRIEEQFKIFHYQMTVAQLQHDMRTKRKSSGFQSINIISNN